MKQFSLRMGLLAGMSVLVLSGCSTSSRTAALQEVDRLCATEAYYKVFKTVELPACSFDKAGAVLMRRSAKAQASDEIIGTTFQTRAKWTFVGGTSESTESRVFRTDYEIFDSANQSIVGVAADFCGSGPVLLVDAPMSGRCCASQPIQALTKAAFSKEDAPCK